MAQSMSWLLCFLLLKYWNTEQMRNKSFLYLHLPWDARLSFFCTWQCEQKPLACYCGRTGRCSYTFLPPTPTKRWPSSLNTNVCLQSPASAGRLGDEWTSGCPAGWMCLRFASAVLMRCFPERKIPGNVGRLVDKTTQLNQLKPFS